MNKFYLIVPGAMLAVFCLYEQSFASRREAAALAEAKVNDAAKVKEGERLAALRQKTFAEAQARVEARDKEEHDRQEKRRLDAEAAVKTLNDETATHATAADQLAVEAAQLEAELNRLREKNQAAADSAVALARTVATARIERRSADLEVQRATTRVATRLNDSPLVNPPLVAMPAK